MKRFAFTTARLACALCLCAALMCPRAGARADERHDELKAAFLFNFMNFVEWPQTASGGPITVCFVGGSGVHDALAAGIKQKRIGNHPIEVRRVGADQGVEGCSVLYMDAQTIAAEGSSLPNDFIPAVLTVSDARQFMREGGIIELFTERNRLRFNVNLQNARKSGLRISSQLLELAAYVDQGDVR